MSMSFMATQVKEHALRTKLVLFVASLLAYALLFGWATGGILLLMIFVHEQGHLSASRFFKIKTLGVFMIPFMGGVALSAERAKTRWQEAIIYLMGPMFGFLFCVVLAQIFVHTGNIFCARAALICALINLFNLLPIYPLDGGGIVSEVAYSVHRVLGFSLKVAAIGGLFLLAVYLGSPRNTMFFGLLALMSLSSIRRDYENLFVAPRILERMGKFLAQHEDRLSTPDALIAHGILDDARRKVEAPPAMRWWQIFLVLGVYLGMIAAFVGIMVQTIPAVPKL